MTANKGRPTVAQTTLWGGSLADCARWGAFAGGRMGFRRRTRGAIDRRIADEATSSRRRIASWATFLVQLPPKGSCDLIAKPSDAGQIPKRRVVGALRHRSRLSPKHQPQEVPQRHATQANGVGTEEGRPAIPCHALRATSCPDLCFAAAAHRVVTAHRAWALKALIARLGIDNVDARQR